MEHSTVKILLPQYIENLCDEETNRMIEEHIEHCDVCRQAYLDMSESLPELEADEHNLKELDPLKKIRHLNHRKNFLIVGLLLAILAVTAGFTIAAMYNEKWTIYSNQTGLDAFESVLECLTENDDIDNLYLCVDRDNGYVINTNIDFEFNIFNPQINCLYQVCGNQNIDGIKITIEQKICLKKEGAIPYAAFVNVIKHVFKEKGEIIRNWDIIIETVNPDSPLEYDYVYDLTGSRFVSKDDTLRNMINKAKPVYNISLTCPKEGAPEEGVLMDEELDMIRICVCNIKKN